MELEESTHEVEVESAEEILVIIQELYNRFDRYLTSFSVLPLIRSIKLSVSRRVP